MSKIENKIDADDRTLFEVLDNKKYTVDYFQREYSWEQRHIEQLVNDLTDAFLTEFKPTHLRSEVENYNSYYLGPFVLSEKGGKRSIIDGQQRLTSLTLFLIFLNNLLKEYGVNGKIESMIFSEKFDTKSFNISVEEREACLRGLYELGEYIPKDDEDESTKNMTARYDDIEKAFPRESIDEKALPYFIDWMKERVILVEIVAYSDDNAYTIFETMNDRGLNLTPTEMLKGYVLSRFKDSNKRQKANTLWKNSIKELHDFDKDEDQRFFQAWLRAKYAETIRPGAAGSKNEDFEKIGTRFHSWVRDNLSNLKLKDESQDSFINFIEIDFKFYLSAYLTIRTAEEKFNPSLEHIYYIKRWGIASSLSYPLMLAPLIVTDSSEDVAQKLNLVARYIETFVVRRSVNFKKFSASSIRYTMYTLVKEIRNKSVQELGVVLAKKIDEMEQTWDKMLNFRLHGQNKGFVKFLLSRITAWVDTQAGKASSFEHYYHSPFGKPYEIEHIWANRFDDHKDEFDQKTDFEDNRNRLGALLLLPSGTNQSYGGKSYSEKVEHYLKENLMAQSLCKKTYENNPNFVKIIEALDLPFEPYSEFNLKEIYCRQALYKRICEIIWAFDSTVLVD